MTDKTMTLDDFLERLKQLIALTDLKGSSPIRLIVGGTAYPVDDVWWERFQDGVGALCIGEDPR